MISNRRPIKVGDSERRCNMWRVRYRIGLFIQRQRQATEIWGMIRETVLRDNKSFKANKYIES